MNLKGKVTLLSFLACVSLISVGFSAWTIHGGDEAEVNGTIYVDGVETKTYLNPLGVKRFEYTIDGYLRNYGSGDSMVYPFDSYQNTFEHGYKIDIATCLKHFPSVTSIELQVRFSYSDSVIEKLNENALASYNEEVNPTQTKEDYIDAYVSNYYDFFNDFNMTIDSIDTVEGFDENGNKNDALIEREALLTQGITQFTYVVYDKENSIKLTNIYMDYISNIKYIENPIIVPDQLRNEVYAKYFGYDVVNTSPLLFKIDGKDRFKFEATLILRTGGEE